MFSLALSSYQKKFKLRVFQVISLGLQGLEPENETMSQLESHEILSLSGLKICKSWRILVYTDLMDIKRTSVNESLPCTLGDISPIVFHTSLV